MQNSKLTFFRWTTIVKFSILRDFKLDSRLNFSYHLPVVYKFWKKKKKKPPPPASPPPPPPPPPPPHQSKISHSPLMASYPLTLFGKFWNIYTNTFCRKHIFLFHKIILELFYSVGLSMGKVQKALVSSILGKVVGHIHNVL